MPFERRVVHYGPGPSDLKGMLSDRAIAGCWFELHRQGGCGAGELRLRDEFPDRGTIEIGDWIALEFTTGDRWYLGRVESREARSPAGVTLRLEGMGVQLSEVFVGGFGIAADGRAPHRYARTDLFPHDPDRSEETVDTVSAADEMVRLLMDQYVAPATDITVDPSLIETPAQPAELTSAKFRGEESVRAIIKDLALRAQGTSWGVDEQGRFFFLRPRSALLASYREGRDTLLLEESRDREHLFNRLLLTGGYVYGEAINSEVTARGLYRWRGNYIQPASRAKYGERRIRLWLPWIRTRSDSRAFAREFFRIYAEPTTRYLVEVGNQSVLPRPWLGVIRLEARDGSELITRAVETIRVQFDHAPRFRMELGPEDPRVHWPEPPHDERWEIPGEEAPEHGGDIISFSTAVSSPFSSDVSSSSSLVSSESSSSSGSSSTASSSSVGGGSSSSAAASSSGTTSSEPSSSSLLSSSSDTPSSSSPSSDSSGLPGSSSASATSSSSAAGSWSSSDLLSSSSDGAAGSSGLTTGDSSSAATTSGSSGLSGSGGTTTSDGSLLSSSGTPGSGTSGVQSGLSGGSGTTSSATTWSSSSLI